MSELDDHEEAVDAGERALAPALLDNVFAERDERLSRIKPLELPIPTWGGKMVAVYGQLNKHEYNRFVGRIGPKTKPSLDQALDAIVVACRGIYLVEDPEATDKTIFTKDGGLKPGVYRVAERYGNELRRHLGDRVPPQGAARDLVEYMMAGDAGVIAAHGTEVLEWVQGGSQEVEAELVGESDLS